MSITRYPRSASPSPNASFETNCRELLVTSAPKRPPRGWYRYSALRDYPRSFAVMSKVPTDSKELAKLRMGIKVLELYVNPEDNNFYFAGYEALPVLLKAGVQIEDYLKEKLAQCRALWVKPN